MTTATRVADARRGLLGGRHERIFALSVTALATLAFGFAALGDAAAPLPAGHYASTASVGIVADNMIRWHVPWPVWSYTADAPASTLAYGHHPWGIFWTTAAIVSVIGRSDLACRLAPILLSTATIPMLYALGARLHRPFAGAAAAAIFAALPISLAFASFNALEVPVIAWSVLSLWGFIGLFGEAPRRRDVVAFTLGALFAAECDWPGCVTSAFLVTGGVTALVLRPALRHGRGGRLRWTGLAATGLALAAALVIQIAWLRAIGKWDDLLSSYDMRSAGKGAPLLRVLSSRRFWLELSFTKLGLAILVVAAPLMIWRARFLRRAIELAPLALGATAAIQYVVFRQGADIHVFWPQHFTPFIALGVAAAIATACEVAASFRPGSPRLVWAAPVLALLATLWVARDGAAALRYARTTGGRFDEKGLLIHSDADVISAMRWAAPTLSPDGVVQLDAGMKPTWSQAWALARPFETHAGLPDEACATGRGARSPAAWLADMRFVSAAVLRELVTRCSVRVVGPLLVVEPEPWRPLRAWSLESRETTTLEGYLAAVSEPIRVATPDVWGAWELRLHLDAPDALDGKPAPTEPKELDELRIALSLAKERGDREAAQRYGAQLMPRIRPLDGGFEDGTRIIGVIDPTRPGEPMQVLVEAAGPLAHGVELAVVGTVVEPMPLSLTMRDPHRREMAMPPRIPPALWRAGWIYVVEVFIHPRPGREELRARLRSRSAAPAPRLMSGQTDVRIAEVETW